MVVLRPIFGTVPRTFPVKKYKVSEVLWAYLCSVEYAGVRPIFVTSTTQIPSGHTLSFEELWAYLCSVGYGGSKTNTWH